MDTYIINMIEIRPNGDCRARVTHPNSGVTVWHGLGPVGEPLRLGPRAGEVRAQRLPHRATREVRVPDHDIALPALDAPTQAAVDDAADEARRLYLIEQEIERMRSIVERPAPPAPPPPFELAKLADEIWRNR